MNTKPFTKIRLPSLCAAVALAFGISNPAALGNGTPSYFDVNGTASGFGIASGPYYDQEGQASDTTTLITGFGNHANVTSVVVVNATGINISMAFAGTGVPVGVIVTSVNGNTIGVSSFTSTAASTGSYTFGEPESWSTSSAGTAIPTIFPSTSPYNQMTFGFSGTDLQGTFNVFLDGGPFNGIAINDSGLNVTLTGHSTTVYPSASAQTWTVATGSLLTVANSAYPFDGGGTVEGLNWNNATVVFAGGGQIIFTTALGCNDPASPIIEDMSSSGTLVLDMPPVGNTTTVGSYSGGFDLNSGTLSFISAGSADQFYGFTATGPPFQINGGTIQNETGSGLTLNWANGGGINIGGNFLVTGYPISFGSAPVTLSTTPTITLFTTLTNGVTSGNGYGLTVLGYGGALVLPGNNTYSGDTIIEAGRLVLLGSISNSPEIVVGGGAIFDVSGQPSPFSLAGRALVYGYPPGTAVLDGNFAGNGSVEAFLPGNPSFIITNGTMSVDGDEFTIVNNGAVLGPGAYCIITNGNNGFVEGTVASVSVGNNGIVPGGTASMQTFGGALYLVISGVHTPPPVFTSISAIGANLNITATNGTDGGFFTLYETTNLNAPVKWSPVLTNRFDPSGNLTQSANIIKPGVPEEFFILSQ